jgi:endonuclease G, mitochondrial
MKPLRNLILLCLFSVVLTSAGIVCSSAQSLAFDHSRNIQVTSPEPQPAQPPPSVNLVLGNPSDATSDADDKDNFLMVKPQFVLSFNNGKGGANWVAWHLQKSDIGNVSRGDFHPDLSLPAGFKRITKANYNNSGYDRGHLCNSKDRTKNRKSNDATFLMTNILPQAADNNQGPWVKLEDFGRTLAGQGKELYVYAGAFGTGGTGKKGFKQTIVNGKVNVPKTFWKVMVILPSGSNDLSRISENTRAIAVCIPNKQGIRKVPWQKFVTTIRNVETATGFDFLSTLSPSIQDAIETKQDSAGSGTGNPCEQ